MARFSDFDARKYRMVDARTGYGEWVATYEGTVEDEMDVALLARVQTVDWSAVREAADLGSGTGRTGAWLHGQGVGAIDGVDVTPEMLERARQRGVFRQMSVADVATTGLPDAAYDLITTSLVDEHLEELAPLYREAFRLGRPGAAYVLVGYHPEFMMVSGMPTHYRNAAGEEIAIDTHLHLISDHVQAALGAGWGLAEMHERLIDDAWVALKPKWERYRGHPISFVFVWRKPA